MPKRTKRSRPAKQSASSTKRLTVSAYGDEGDVLNEREIQVFETDPAYVRVNAGVTKNLGNYESLRVDVSLSVPCYQEMVDETFEAVADQVSGMLADEVENYLEDKG